jgi:hypothetical protein
MQLRSLFAAAALLSASVAAHADSYTTFALDGTFTNGGTVTGTIYADTTSGVIESSNLELDGVPGDYDVTQTGLYATTDEYIFYNTPQGAPLDLLFQLFISSASKSLAGYPGGAICSTTTTCQYASEITNYDARVIYQVESGTLTATPEPSSFFLLGLGLIGVAGVVRRHSPIV